MFIVRTLLLADDWYAAIQVVNVMDKLLIVRDWVSMGIAEAAEYLSPAGPGSVAAREFGAHGQDDGGRTCPPAADRLRNKAES